jgi:biopolymer transport protein ExbD
MQAAINITPLVDVVLVLLIIFMVMAPQLRKGPTVELPETAKPLEQGQGEPIRVTIDERGGLWVDDRLLTTEQFGEGLRTAAGGETNTRVVIQGDARLHFGDIRNVMLAIEAAGFHGVGLLAERTATTRGR